MIPKLRMISPEVITLSTNRKNVIKYRKPITINVGFIVFSTLFIYIIICVILYFSKEQLSLYEVIEKKIADNNIFQGLILREEQIINCDSNGYINYYAGEGERISKNSVVYSIDQNGEVYNLLTNSESGSSFTTEDTNRIRNTITTFQSDYQNGQFNSVYDLKYDIENTVLELSNINMLSKVNDLLEQQGISPNSFNLITAKDSGIISYTIDGMEGLKEDTISAANLVSSKYQRTQLRSSDPQKAGSPVFKLVTNDNWSIILPLKNKNQYEKLSENKRIRITFLKDNLTTAANITCYQKDGSYFAALTLNKYMVRYLSDRFIDIELSINSAEGLKIPISSITKKDFFKIPLNYFQENMGNQGVVIEKYDKKGTPNFQFVTAEKYYEDEQFAYIDTNLIEAGTFIHRTDQETKNEERYEVKEIGTLEGVYNVNKGYSVFRRIEKEYENSEYCIVKTDTKYGLSTYDHIVLNAKLVKNQKIIY